MTATPWIDVLDATFAAATRMPRPGEAFSRTMARELLVDPRWGAMPPSIVLATLLGSIYGLLGHAFVGQRWRQLPVYWLGGIIGFFGGYLAVALGGGGLLRLGAVPLLEPSLGSCLVLALIWWSIGRRPLPADDANDD